VVRARRHGIDLHLHRRGVGKRVERQLEKRVDAHPHEQDGDDQHRDTVLDRPVDDPIEHGA
jgi:hypothetical protein